MRANMIALLFGLLSFSVATAQQSVNIAEVIIPAGIDSMGDHFNFGDPQHPSDEKPIHLVKTDSFYMAVYIITNQQYLSYLNDALQNGLVVVKGDSGVFPVGGTEMYCYLNHYASFYSIAYNGSNFYLADFRADHPMVGVMWNGAAAYCNWLSQQNGLQPCYNVSTWACDFSLNGYRLPTEAEWEWAGRGGHTNPYHQYLDSDTADVNAANLSGSVNNPYHTGSVPYTTPVGFYDGTLKLKTDYNWPGTAGSYQTKNGINGFGLYDMQGNVWEFCNDWYQNTYYAVSPYDNPTGPPEESASLMPDGKPYRVQRGGNWWNGDLVYGVDDGHSRVSNRDPLYYRGPGGPWHQEGFRVARKYNGPTSFSEPRSSGMGTLQAFPNPFYHSTTLTFSVSETEDASLEIQDARGRLVASLHKGISTSGSHSYLWNAENLPAGVYFCSLRIGEKVLVKKVVLVRAPGAE